MTRQVAEASRNMREIERVVLLNNVDRHWMDHIDAMDQLRQGIGLGAYAHRNPIVEYKVEGFDMFEEMVHGIREQTVAMLFHVSLQTRPEGRGRQGPPGSATGTNPPLRTGSGRPRRSGKRPGATRPVRAGAARNTRTAADATSEAVY